MWSCAAAELLLRATQQAMGTVGMTHSSVPSSSTLAGIVIAALRCAFLAQMGPPAGGPYVQDQVQDVHL
jgi:hypothetical protein